MLSLLALTGLAAPAAHAASVAPVQGREGMVVSAQALATRVGVDVLRRGGTAVDAGIAVAYALAVVYPAAGNLGGGGFMTLVLADGRHRFIDFRETAPASARADMYLDAGGQVRSGASTEGYAAVAVPGTVAGLELARERYGTLPRSALIAPAIELARKGFVLEDGDAALLAEGAKAMARDPVAASIFLHADGSPLRAGERLRQPDLARTLQRIAQQGASGFYAGPTAHALALASARGGGGMTEADLGAYAARERAAVECDYRGLRVVTAPPPSSGGVALCQMLGILEAYPLADWGFRSARALRVQIGAMRAAYADRNRFLGDPDAVHVPVDELLAPAHLVQMRAQIDQVAAAPPGASPHEGQNTTHFSVADRMGNAVSVTYTLNDWFGAKVVPPGTGVLLNDEMDDFTVAPGVPNLYGLVQGEANRIGPGRRPLSSMTPTVVLLKGRPLLVTGTPGGSRIITTVLHNILNVVDYGMDLQEAVDAPRFHQQGQPAATEAEPRAIGPDARAQLAQWGETVRDVAPRNHLAAILIGGPTLAAAVSATSQASSPGAAPTAVPGVAGGPQGLPVGRGEVPGPTRFFGANDPRRRSGLALGY
jgi:gamma-glutamyltranspeptidase/glutathione hydrolase